VPPTPLPDPPPLRKVGNAFELRFRDARSGETIQEFQNPFEIRMSYTDRQLAAAGIVDERRLRLHSMSNAQWRPAGSDVVDSVNNQIVTTLRQAGIFALAEPQA
jgi:hypothetical protein